MPILILIFLCNILTPVACF